MLAPVRRGGVLARTLRTCIARPSRISLGVQQAIKSHQLAPLSSSLSIRNFHAYPALRSLGTNEAVKTEEEPSTEFTEFSQLAESGLVSDKVINVITGSMGIKTMTDVQRMTINATLKGSDVLAQAKTGTGKTLAFLMPVVQNILMDPTLEKAGFRRNRSSAADIRAIVISPTRELAEQIAVEARKIVGKTGVIVQTAVGGSRKREALQRMQREGCHILVGTPGRLIDIFSDPTTGVAAPKLSAFVLDEADRLLDIGFAPDIKELQSYFPRREEVDRQTLMFSATVPNEVMNMVRTTMKPDFAIVKTVQENEVPTHLAVPQKLVFLRGMENQLPAIFEIAQNAVEKHQKDPETARPFKAIVYFNSTAEVALAKKAFLGMREQVFSPHPIPGLQCYEIHSRLTQEQRTRASQNFRDSQNSVLFSSDVTARGMDFPNVTHVIQVGVPANRETYVHRLGRTARANKTGEGWLLALDMEYDTLLQKLHRLPLKEDNKTLLTANADMASEDANLPSSVSNIVSYVRMGFKSVPAKDKTGAFMAYLGTMSGSRDKFQVIEYLKQLAKNAWGLDELPAVSPTLLAKLGYRGAPGLNVSAFEPGSGASGFGSRTSFRGNDRRSSYGSSSRGSFGRRDSDSYGSRGGSFGGRGSNSYGSRGSNFGGRGSNSYGSRGSSFGGRGSGSYNSRGSGREFGGERRAPRNDFEF
ncbi:hypothetical protein FQN55_002300 [Onygenales sp. PD_40]|nr:hypothetical protein FQN55_002300 [Onygenales sp. PD_40]KAK2785783.1 hypothetical protein FQN53_007363 [Emmonsiellopsis sp. PD_33]KAK2786025.1 hypothetical protein FQN52_008021 [Onygenales sp. PD_12]KAK2801582.1 hypothetical protein FQN51_005289 [Onygenales sp. PD_10]